ncbi:hypothetical protein XENTR_v10000053 [Xenopus tropicalis]|nr:hypothetical protein XENTR_v10000053 [Xenopus tropicalis]
MRRAEQRTYGLNLSLPKHRYIIRWKGIGGLKWFDLLATISLMVKKWGYPGMIVIHLGGNDLGFYKTIDIISAIKYDLSQLCLLMPDVALVWSEIIPRLCWQTGRLKPLEKCRRKLNHTIDKFAKQRHIQVYRHHELEDAEEGLFHDDGVHLSPIGLDIFNTGLQNAIEKALLVWEGPSPS